MAKKKNYKYKCLTCGTEFISSSLVEICGACGSNEMKRFNVNDKTCPDNIDDFILRNSKKFIALKTILKIISYIAVFGGLIALAKLFV